MRCAQPSLHQPSNLADRGKHADKSQRAAANELLTVHKDGELSVASLHHFHLEIQVAPQRCRHTGCLNARDSITAAANSYSHGRLLLLFGGAAGRTIRGMTKAAKAVLAEALRLGEHERAELAAEVLASLDGPADADADAAWEAEIRRRIAAIDAGEIELEPWDAVKRRIEKETLGR